MTYYVTKGTCVRKGKREPFEYRTKSLTPYHEELRKTYPGAKTLRCDTSVEWPFGVYAEVVAQ